MRGKALLWGLLGLALLVALEAARDRYDQIGRPFAGVLVMENLLVAVGGGERGGLKPFDLVRTIDGQILRSGVDLQARVRDKPPGTTFHYLLYRKGQLVEAEVTSRVTTGRDFVRFLLEGLLPGLLVLALGVLVVLTRPARSWLFLAFCLVWSVISVTYIDASTTYRFTGLFLVAWALSPAIFVHMALTMLQPRGVLHRHPRLVWAPYGASSVLALMVTGWMLPGDAMRAGVVAAAGSAYWGTALIFLVLALATTGVTGSTPLARQRARVVTAGLTVGYLVPVVGTAVEAMFRVPVPYLGQLWRLTIVFPASVAYAMVRYNLFDVRALLRAGTIYSAVTGLVVLVYAGAIAVLDVLTSGLELSSSPIVPAALVAVAVVLFLNPVYVRTQKVVDRLFFRQRVDTQRSLEQVSEVMTGLLDLDRIVALIGEAVDELFHPARRVLLLYDETARGYVWTGQASDEAPRVLRHDSPLPVFLASLRGPVTRERLEEDPGLQEARTACLAEMEALGAELVVPVLFRERVTAFLALGPKRSGAAYTTDDLRLLRLLLNQSAVALEHAKAYTALGHANAELRDALRRVEILERIRSNLSKFVPRTVQSLIEQAPEAPELDKREADVSVLFVDIVGYVRLSERLDPDRVNELVERYFGAFLDQILRRGGDVNETAGDGLMAIFRDADPRRHARAAVKTALAILRRAREINAKQVDLSEPIAFHIGVNSGAATVGATKIEGKAGIRWTYTASGSVTNLAARLAGLAEGDEIIVGPETRSRVAQEFEFDDLGEQPLRNVEHPVRVFRLAAAPAAIESHG